jgi:hypothetical protein
MNLNNEEYKDDRSGESSEDNDEYMNEGEKFKMEL